MGNKKKSKVEIVLIIISWLFTLSPYLLFLFIEWYYVLFITSLIFSIRAYTNSTKSNYSSFKAVIITLIFNIFGSLYVHQKINKNLKASFIKAREKTRAELKEEHKKEKAKRIAEQKAAEVQRQAEEAKVEAEDEEEMEEEAKQKAAAEVKVDKENIEVEFGGGGLVLDISVEKLENAVDESGSDIYFDRDSKFVELGSDVDTAYSFFLELTDKKLVVYAEYDSEDDEGNDIRLVNLEFLNCECPDNLKKYYTDNLKKYYNGFLLIIRGKLIDVNSSAYNNIDIDEAWEYSEIRNSGVQCEEVSNDFHLNFTY